jgi:hypothetical protein
MAKWHQPLKASWRSWHQRRGGGLAALKLLGRQ